MLKRLILVGALAFGVVGRPVYACPEEPPLTPAQSETVILSGLNLAPEMVAMIADKDPYIAADGAVEKNAVQPEHVAHQRHAIWRLWGGLHDDAAQFDVADAMRWSYQYQDQNQGYFLTCGCNGIPSAPSTASLEADVFFLSAHGHTVRLLSEVNSPHGLADLNPNYGLAMDWIAQHVNVISNEGQLYRTNVLWFAAQAFIFGAIELDRSDLYSLGAGLASQAIGQQHADGWFPEHNGWDSSYNAVSMLHLAIVWAYIPDGPDRDALHAALVASAAWQKSRILASGEVNAAGNTRSGPQYGPGKEINYPEVAMALFYAGMITGDGDALDLAELVAEYYLANS